MVKWGNSIGDLDKDGEEEEEMVFEFVITEKIWLGKEEGSGLRQASIS